MPLQLSRDRLYIADNAGCRDSNRLYQVLPTSSRLGPIKLPERSRRSTAVVGSRVRRKKSLAHLRFRHCRSSTIAHAILRSSSSRVGYPQRCMCRHHSSRVPLLQSSRPCHSRELVIWSCFLRLPESLVIATSKRSRVSVLHVESSSHGL